MSRSQGEVSAFPSTPTALCVPAPRHCGNAKPICSTNYVTSEWEYDPGRRQSQSEQKRPEDTSAVGAFWFEIFRDCPLRVYRHLTCFSLTHTLYRDLAKALIQYSLITAKQSQLNLCRMLINTWLLTAKCLHKGIHISMCSTIFLTTRKC